MAVALPMPLLAPVTIKDLPTTDTSKCRGLKSLDAASNPFLGAQSKHIVFVVIFPPIPYREQTFTVTRSCFNNAKKEKKKITVILTKVSR